MLSEVLTDILAQTHGLGFIEMMKIDSSATETTIAAINDDKSVVAYGTLNSPLTELDGVVGLSRMAVLQGYLKYPHFCDSSATIEILTTQRDGSDVPTEIHFATTGGHESSYRFMHKDVVEEQVKVPNFKGAEWDVVIAGTDELLKDLSYFNGVLGAFEPTFTAKTDANGDLNFYIGSGPTDRATVPVAKSVNGALTGNLTWPLVETLAILKLASKADDCTISFSNKGVLKIEMETGIGSYEYLLPARSM
jgi:hypothetical protein